MNLYVPSYTLSQLYIAKHFNIRNKIMKRTSKQIKLSEVKYIGIRIIKLSKPSLL